MPAVQPPVRRHLLRAAPVLAVTALVAALAACGGGDDPVATGDPGDATTSTVVGPAGVGAIEHPTGAGDVVLEIRDEGGFVPADVNFAAVPRVLVTGDGRVVLDGPVPAIYPGPLLPNLQQHQIGEDGVQQLLALADEHGLLADVTYDGPTNVADAPDTVVVVSAGGRTYEHRAYALGLSGEAESDPARARLQDFVAAAEELTVAGARPGDETDYESDTFLVRATPVDPGVAGQAPDGIEPRQAEWPAGAPRLADAAECAAVPAAVVGDLLRGSDQLTRFIDGGAAYVVAAVPALPGRSCG